MTVRFWKRSKITIKKGAWKTHLLWVILRGFEAVFWLTVAGFESDEESDLSDEDEIRISEDAWDLICRLICERENRIGAKAVTASRFALLLQTKVV